MRRLPWILLAVSVALTLVAFALLAVSGDSGSEGSLAPAFDVVMTIALLSFPTVGALVASRHPATSSAGCSAPSASRSR